MKVVKKFHEGSFVEGREDGNWKQWYSDGKIDYTGDFKNGKMEGKWEGWYQSGKKKYETIYSENLKKRNGYFLV